MIEPIQPLGALPTMPTMPDGPAPAPAADGGQFGGVLTRAIAGLNDQLIGSERLSEAAATGALPDPSSALVEVEKADLAFQFAVQVRNRLVEGWQELSRMGV